MPKHDDGLHPETRIRTPRRAPHRRAGRGAGEHAVIHHHFRNRAKAAKEAGESAKSASGAKPKKRPSKKVLLERKRLQETINARRADREHFAPPDFQEEDDAVYEDAGFDPLDIPTSGQKRKLLLGLVLVPICIVAVITLFELFFRATVDGKFWKSEGFWFFAFGCLLWFVLGWARMQPAWLYVFAHEFTHVIAARLSGGKVHAMHVSDEGGYIETDKTNVLITLSPYLVPLYTVVVFAIYGLLSLVVDMHRDVMWTIPFTGWTVWIRWAWPVYFFVGMTWCFHITFTLEVLRTEQSDLAHNGEFFSIILIFLTNLALIGAMFIAASPTVDWADVWRDAQAMVEGAWGAMKRLVGG